MEAYALDKEKDDRDGERCRASLRALKPIFGDLAPSDINRDLCRSFADKRRSDGISDGTIIRDLKVMKAACSWSGGPVGAFWYPSTPEPRNRTISKAELQSLIDASPFHLQIFIHVAYATAARAGAIYELTWLQVRDDSIYLGRKANGKNRATVPMTETLKSVLEVAKEIAETDYVIEFAGKPVRSVKKAWAAACERAGIDGFRIHDLRHTAACHMAGDGVSMSKISQYLGHSNIHITSSIYARYAPEHLRDAADALELNRF